MVGAKSANKEHLTCKLTFTRVEEKADAMLYCPLPQKK
jgi:hypothetical protein